jgi:hypothetical protein
MRVDFDAENPCVAATFAEIPARLNREIISQMRELSRKNREFEPRLRATPATIEKTPPAHAKHREKCNKAALRPEIPKSLVPRATTASNVSFGSRNRHGGRTKGIPRDGC